MLFDVDSRHATTLHRTFSLPRIGKPGRLRPGCCFQMSRAGTSVESSKQLADLQTQHLGR